MYIADAFSIFLVDTFSWCVYETGCCCDSVDSTDSPTGYKEKPEQVGRLRQRRNLQSR